MMTRLVVYPAILDDSENEKGVYTVTFPDVPSAITFGNGLGEALKNAEEVLGLMLYDKKELPKPSNIEVIRRDNPRKIVNLVETDLDLAKKEVKKPVVKKNTTLPGDLAERAEKAGINFSQTLAHALRTKLAKMESK